MKLLLDTHAFIWWDSEPGKLSPRALALCEDPANQVHLSVASLWEIKIKQQLGKLVLASPLSEIVKAQQETNGLVLVDVKASHTYALEDLPGHHKDPFDRMIIAQAKAEALCVISHDGIMRKYPVAIEW